MIDDEVFWHANRRKKKIGKLAPPPNWPLDNNQGKVDLVTEYLAAPYHTNSVTHHGYQLGELELELNRHHLRHVGHGPHQLVVVGQEVIVEALGVGVPA